MSFMPERFSECNIRQRNPYTFFPYGVDAGSCFEIQFQHLLIKVGLVSFLSIYRVKTFTINDRRVLSRQPIPLNYDKPINLQIENFL